MDRLIGENGEVLQPAAEHGDVVTQRGEVDVLLVLDLLPRMRRGCSAAAERGGDGGSVREELPDLDWAQQLTAPTQLFGLLAMIAVSAPLLA